MNNKKNNKILGFKGEQIAEAYLLRKGFAILQKNWRWRRLEVDLIARKDPYLIFVEVKTRSSAHYGDPLEAVGRKKERYLSNAATAYIRKFGWEQEVRFDIITIIKTEGKVRLRHIENAFFPIETY